MPTEAVFSSGALFGFLFVLARVSGLVAFVPFPGLRNGPEIARIVLAVSLSICLFPKWPLAVPPPESMGRLFLSIVAEAGFGATIGLLVSFLMEGFQLGAQVLSVQAGYSYASTIDPNTQADSGVVPVLFQLLIGMCFFASGTDREILRAVAMSLDRFPPGTFSLSRVTAEIVTSGGAAMFSTGIRIALPMIAFLLMIDLALALLGRIQSQLQLLSLAFPAKMLASLLLLASMATLFPKLFHAAAGHMMQSVAKVAGI